MWRKETVAENTGGAAAEMKSELLWAAAAPMLTSASHWCWTLWGGGCAGGGGSRAAGCCGCRTGTARCSPPAASSGCWRKSINPPLFSARRETLAHRYRHPHRPPPALVWVCSPRPSSCRCEPAEMLTPTSRCSRFWEERSDNLWIHTAGSISYTHQVCRQL